MFLRFDKKIFFCRFCFYKIIKFIKFNYSSIKIKSIQIKFLSILLHISSSTCFSTFSMFFRLTSLFDELLMFIFRNENLIFLKMFIRRKLNDIRKSSNNALSKFNRFKSSFHFFVFNFIQLSHQQRLTFFRFVRRNIFNDFSNDLSIIR